MEDVQYEKERLELANILKFTKLRLYKYGLSSDEVNKLCMYKTTQNEGNPEITIETLSSGMFGRAELLTYKNKQYVRKIQKVFIDPTIASLMSFPETFSPFLNEIQIMQKLSMHPSMYKYVPVFYGHATEGDSGIYIMEYLQGDTLQHICSKRGLSDEERVFVQKEIETILTELHKAGYVFNDVHGNNFFVIMEGNTIKSVILIDFGLTKPLDKAKQVQYLKNLSIYNQNVKARKRRPIPPNIDRNIPEFNLLHYKLMKTQIWELDGCEPHTPAVVLDVPAKPRDYELANELNQEQKADILAIDGQISKLQLKILRQSIEGPIAIPHVSNARQSIKAQRNKSVKQGIKNIAKGFRSVFKKEGGKVKTRKQKRRI